jgi:hypothetical protein
MSADLIPNNFRAETAARARARTVGTVGPQAPTRRRSAAPSAVWRHLRFVLGEEITTRSDGRPKII